jgi:multidrug efflux pump subunit AcrA (membrane-fusion protein)
MARIYTYGELKESKLIYDRKPPAFGVIITFMTLVFVAAAILWAAFSTKTYVVKAAGLVASEAKTNVMNTVSGTIKDIRVTEGQLVEKGEILIEIDSFQTELQIAQIQAMVDFYQQKVNVIERLIVFVNAYKIDDPSTQVNPFDANVPEEVKAYSDAQTIIDYLQQQARAAQDEEPPRAYTQAEADNIKSQFLSQQYTAYDEYGGQLVQQDIQLKMYQNSLSEYYIKAEQKGIVHLTAGITIGTVIQAGSLLGNISSETSDDYYFETVLNAADKSKIKVGDGVEIAVGGVMQSEYGVLLGEVTAIDTDSTQTEDGQVFYRVKIKPEKTQLKDKSGNTIDITTGMLAESRIKYDETTWLKWAIEQIGIKFR